MRVLVVLLGFSVLSVRCASVQNIQTVPTQAVGSVTRLEAYGPPAPASASQGVQREEGAASLPMVRPMRYGPDPVELHPVVLVLGPGLARGLGYAGLFRALHAHRIPIAAILGTEMGGVMAALYGMSGNLNQFEWGLLRLKTELFENSQGLFGSLTPSHISRGNSAQLAQVLDRVFQKADLRAAKIPVRLSVASQDTREVKVLGEGTASAIVYAAVAVPELFESHGNWVAAAQGKPFLVTEAKQLDLGPVIAVSLLDYTDSPVVQEELKKADLVISIRMAEVGLYDFKKRNQAAFQGRNAVIAHLKEIRHLVGFGE